ncbi:MAG: tetratricopeptide repeat protein [Fidelibacterota bacterium]
MWQHKYKINSINQMMVISCSALVFAVPLIYSSKLFEITLYPKFMVLAVVVFILMILWMIKLIRYKNHLLFSTPLTLPILFFLIINIVSLNAAVNIYESLFPLTKLFLLSILFFIIINNISQNGIDLILKVWAFSGGIISIVGIGQYLGFGFDWIPSAGNPSSTFGYRNIAAMFLIMTLPITGFLFIKCRRNSRMIFWGIIFSLLSIFLIYTRTRGAWVGLTGALVLSAILLKIVNNNQVNVTQKLQKQFQSKQKRTIALIVCGVIVICSTIDPKTDLRGSKAELFSTVSSIIGDGGDSGRFGMWKASLDMFSDGSNWLTGVGVNNWQFLYPAYAQGHMINFSHITRHPHNDYLSILTETGVIGFFIYIWLLLTVFSMMLKLLKQDTNAINILLTVSLFISFTAILIHSFFSFPKEHIAISMFFWLIMSLITTIYTQLHHHGLETPMDKDILKLKNNRNILYQAIIIGMLVFSFMSIGLAKKHIFSDYHFKKAFQYYYRENYSEAIQELNKAEIMWHNSWKSSYLYGITLLKMNNLSESISHFERSLTYSPYFLKVHHKLGIAYFRMKNYQEAVKHFAYTIVIYPDYGRGYYNLGLAWHNLGNLEEAEKNYRLSLKHDPNIGGAYNNLGVILKARGEMEKALIYFEKALEQNPDTIDTLMNIDSLNLNLE